MYCMIHPSQDELAAFKAGRIAAADADRIEAHLAECPECGQRLDELDVHGDPLLQALRAAKTSLGELPIPAAASSGGSGDCRRSAADRFGRYQVMEELGRGGMGIVYRAFDPHLRRIVALKVVMPERLGRAEDRSRFQAEAEAAARLQHANIVQIYDLGENRGELFFAMEYVEGGSLARRLPEQAMPFREAAATLAVLGDAVEYAHQRKIVHRDLKPANILLTGDGTPKIADFGLCKRLDEQTGQTVDGALLGSPSYMAPEQAEGSAKTIGPATDVYGLGAILYEVLTGRPPFGGASAWETLLAVKSSEPAPPSRFQRHVPRDLETICLKCLEKTPSRRYENAAALAADLRRFLDGVPVAARKPGVVERAARTIRRYPGISALSALLSVSLVAIAVILLIYNARLRQSLEEARRDMYSLQLQRCAALAEEDPDHALTLLEDENRSPPDLRDFAWHYLRKACNREIFCADQGEEALCLTVAADGSRFAVGDARGRIVIRTDSGEPRLTLVGPAVRITDLAFDPKRPQLASSGEDGVVRLWDVRTGKCVRDFSAAVPTRPENPLRCNAVRFSPDGKMLAAGYSDGIIRLWDPESARCTKELVGERASILSLSFNRSGRVLAAAARNETLRFWSIPNGEPACRLETAHGYVTNVQFHPLEPSVFATTGGEGMVRLWEAVSGHVPRLRCTLRGSSRPATANSIAFSPDGKKLAVGRDDHTLQVWSVETGVRSAVFRGHAAQISAVGFITPDKVLAAGKNGRIQALSLNPGLPPRCLAAHNKKAVTALAFFPDRRHIISSGCDGALRLWTREGDKLFEERRSSDDWIGGIACARGTPRIAWRREDTFLTARIEGCRLVDSRTLWVEPMAPSSFAFSADGSRLAVGSAVGGGVKMIDTVSGTPLDPVSAPETLAALTFLPRNGSLVGVGNSDCLWVCEKNRKTFVARSLGRSDSYTIVCCSAEGDRLAVGAASGRIALIDANEMRVLAWLEGHSNAVTGLCFCPGGAHGTLASADAGGEIRLWDATSGPERGRLSLPSPIGAMAFADDGSALACGCDDGMIYIWEVGG
jgi:eukaryotic-like serine/threonine-protein kinase